MVSVLTSDEVRTLRDLARNLKERGLTDESATLWQILTSSRREEVSASAAARILHVTPRIIRNWVKRGILDGRTDVQRHVYVRVSSLMPAIELDAILPRRAADEPDISEDEILAEIAAGKAASSS